MVSAFEAASCILNECESLSTMKLQKLLFYSQAYHLVRYGEPLIEEDFEAWANGPVVRSLFNRHKGHFVISKGFFDEEPSEGFDDRAADAISHVVGVLGGWSGADLSILTHSEKPWKAARGNHGPCERCSEVIPKESIRGFYSSDEARSNPVFAL